MSPSSRLPFPLRLRSNPALWGLLLAFAGCGGRPTQPLSVPDAGACLTSACTEADSGTPPDPSGPRVRIAAFNVHRLFDTVCDSGSCGGSAYEELPTEAELAQKVDRLGRAITALNADVVMLEEVETQRSLDALQAHTPGFDYSELGETGAPASVDVAVLSRYPIIEVRHHRDYLVRPDGSSTRFSRELLEVHVDVNGERAIVFAAHFRSKVDDDPGRRFAEATVSRDTVTAVAKEFPSALVVFGGDLNDTPGSDAINALEKDGALLRVASDRPDSETWTYVYSGQRQAIDHLFLARGGGTYVPGSFRVARDGNSYGGSDHGAVYADFGFASRP
ncbi:MULTISPECIES: endonuclease/exonuclease/phosphatase family protein [Corallococcus]|uniref:endonuclease/exonuclease/phosphatase family protein n=1 Tax=Corallococcus TaxID=83461 RepID=UPI001180E21C|nr:MULTISPECIES: endonuclease/exonuclease/phosphatase family protein [Corallococcus]NBD08757.1 endonuclease/exonuclease/phosphatase family protein [Corallococcus silvisoli]TSC32717.1 endonuclease/exonuclease/phosphatase family protein [Corallococcus sp. Z5C101001]